MDDMVKAYIEATYKKIRLLKKSDKSEIWLALDNLDNLVVLKRIFMTNLPYKILMENPVPLIPKIIYCAESEEETFVVEEYIQGESLLTMLKNKRYLTEAEAKNILAGLCDGLKPIHDLGIIHRDIKPSNLILQNGGVIRLIDFDAARIVKEDKAEDTRLLGTKGYAPPEQFGYGQTDLRSDIYSIGVTVKKMLGDKYRGFLTPILSKCAEIDPNKRYANVDELKQAVLFKNKRLKFKAFAAFFLILIIVITVTINSAIMTKEEEIKMQEEIEETVNNTQINEKNEEKIKEKIEEKIEKQENEIKQDLTQDLTLTKESIVKDEAVLPQKAEPPAQKKISNEPIKARLYVNDAVITNSSPKILPEMEDWKNYRASLVVENKTDSVWENPTIRVVFSVNWGQKHIETMTLPPIEPGASREFSIPVGSYPISNRAPTYAWLQVYLDAGNLPSEEKYWCAQFEIKGGEPYP